jgi:type IV secretion system protein VirB8
MADIEPLFPNMPVPRAAQEPLLLSRRNEVNHWIEHNVEQERRGRRVAWIVACVLIVICAAQAAAIALMLPLKEIVPYTILVDKQTGYVETARGLDVGTLAEDQAIVESMVAQYVLARETFDPADFAERYDRVTLWSLGQPRDDYVAQYQAGGPDSVLNDIRPGTMVKVTVKRIDLLTSETALVRFETQRSDPGFGPLRSDWQAVVSYRFTGAPMRMEDRLLNPLGFQVTGYRRDPETAANKALIHVPAQESVPAETSLAQDAADGVDSGRVSERTQ